MARELSWFVRACFRVALTNLSLLARYRPNCTVIRHKQQVRVIQPLQHNRLCIRGDLLRLLDGRSQSAPPRAGRSPSATPAPNCPLSGQRCARAHILNVGGEDHLIWPAGKVNLVGSQQTGPDGFAQCFRRGLGRRSNRCMKVVTPQHSLPHRVRSHSARSLQRTSAFGPRSSTAPESDAQSRCPPRQLQHRLVPHNRFSALSCCSHSRRSSLCAVAFSPQATPKAVVAPGPPSSSSAPAKAPSPI